MYRLFALFLLPLALLGNEVVDYLKQYEGRWVGDFTIHSTATEYTETFPVEQRYWWEDGQLRGISVSETNRGMETARSRTFIQDGQLRSEVVTADAVETFVGAMHDGGIVWVPSDLKRATDYQMREPLSKKTGSVGYIRTVSTATSIRKGWRIWFTAGGWCPRQKRSS